MASPPDEDELWLHGEAAKKLNALYANRIFAQPLGEGMVRVSFGEMKETYDPEYHTAIVATPELALEFADVIQRVALGVLQAQAEQATARTAHEQYLKDILGEDDAAKTDGRKD